MNEFIERVINLYVKGLITNDEMASLIAKEYSKLWVRGKILELVGE
jgi:hypothetical protein